MCTPSILARANLEAGVTSLMRKIPKACNWRLTVFVGGNATSDGEEFPQTLTPLLMMMEMVATGLGPGLLPVSLFRSMRTIITNGGVRVHLTKVWAMILWVGLLTKSLNHCLRVELKGESFLNVSHSQHWPMSLFRTMRTIITNRGVRVHLAKVWTTILWVGLLNRSLNHRLHVELKGERFLSVSHSQHSPCISDCFENWHCCYGLVIYVCFSDIVIA